jgi:hypothetical protein
LNGFALPLLFIPTVANGFQSRPTAIDEYPEEFRHDTILHVFDRPANPSEDATFRQHARTGFDW